MSRSIERRRLREAGGSPAAPRPQSQRRPFQRPVLGDVACAGLPTGTRWACYRQGGPQRDEAPWQEQAEFAPPFSGAWGRRTENIPAEQEAGSESHAPGWSLGDQAECVRPGPWSEGSPRTLRGTGRPPERMQKLPRGRAEGTQRAQSGREGARVRAQGGWWATAGNGCRDFYRNWEPLSMSDATGQA